MVSATHNLLGPSAKIKAHQIAGWTMIGRPPRFVTGAHQRRLTPAIPSKRISRGALAGDGTALSLQLDVDARRSVDPVRTSVDRADAARQIGVGGRPCRSRTASPSVIAGGRKR